MDREGLPHGERAPNTEYEGRRAGGAKERAMRRLMAMAGLAAVLLGALAASAGAGQAQRYVVIELVNPAAQGAGNRKTVAIPVEQVTGNIAKGGTVTTPFGQVTDPTRPFPAGEVSSINGVLGRSLGVTFVPPTSEAQAGATNRSEFVDWFRGLVDPRYRYYDADRDRDWFLRRLDPAYRYREPMFLPPEDDLGAYFPISSGGQGEPSDGPDLGPRFDMGRVLDQPAQQTMLSPELVGILDSSDWKQLEAERLRQHGLWLLDDKAAYDAYAEARRKQAEEVRKLAQKYRDNAKSASDPKDKASWEKDAKQADEKADDLDRQADGETRKGKQAEQDADKKFDDAKKAEDEAKRLDQERREAERRAAEERAQREQAEREARRAAEEAQRKAAEEAKRQARADAERRAREELDRQRQQEERDIADRQARFQQSGRLAEQTGGQVEVQGERKGPGLGSLAKDVGFKGGGEYLKHEYGKAGSGAAKLVKGVDDFLKVKRFGEAADRVVERSKKEIQAEKDMIDRITDPRDRTDPQKLRDMMREHTKQRVLELIEGQKPLGSPR